jgi:hypothetical protein
MNGKSSTDYYIVMIKAIHDRLLLCEPFDSDSLEMAGSNSQNM